MKDQVCVCRPTEGRKAEDRKKRENTQGEMKEGGKGNREKEKNRK
jgi:hypothetical protein